MKALQFTGSLLNYAVTRVVGRFWRPAFWGPLSCLAYREVPVPSLPGPDWALVKTRYGGVCGSDVHLVLLETSPTTSAFTSFPFTIGHENVGRLAEAGEGVKALGLRPGQRVVADLLLPCAVRGIEPPCPPCRRGDYSQCENFARGTLAPGMLLGGCRDVGGSWSPYFLAHKSQLFAVPDTVSDEAAVLVEPLSVSLHAAARALGGGPDRTVLVVGGGIIGLGVVAALRYLGDRSRVIVLARHRHQADLARELGADEVVGTGPGWEGGLAERLGAELRRPLVGRGVPDTGAAVVFECAGTASALDTALRFAAPGGRVVLAGLAAAPRGIDWSFVWRKELTVVGTFCSGTDTDADGRRKRTFQIALDLLAASRFDFGRLVTHRFRLADYKRALATVTAKGRSKVVKAVFEFD